MDTETTASAVLNEEQLSLDLIEAQYALMNTRDQSNAKSLVILVLGKTPDTEEIIYDVEQRMAELLKNQNEGQRSDCKPRCYLSHRGAGET